MSVLTLKQNGASPSARSPDIEELRRWLKNVKTSHGLTLKSVAEQAGCDRTTVSRFANEENYVPGPEVISKIQEMKERLGDQRANPESFKSRLEFTTTSNVEYIHAVCYECMNKHIMGAIIGYSGAGKTTALERFARKNNAIYIQADPTYTIKELMKDIASHLGESTSGTACSIKRKVVSSLINRPRLIIIDEANKLVGDRHGSVVKIESMRAVYDQVKKIGLVLAGTPELLVAVLDGPPSLAQLRSRIRRIIKLEPPGAADIANLLAGFNLTDEARFILKQRAVDTQNGGLRWLDSTISACIDLVGTGGVISREVIEEADTLLIDEGLFRRGTE